MSQALIPSLLKQLQPQRFFGHIVEISGQVIHVAGLNEYLTIGSLVEIDTKQKTKNNLGEVIGFHKNYACIMPFDGIAGMGIAMRVYLKNDISQIFPSTAWLGRVINAFGEPIDGKGPLPTGEKPIPLDRRPPEAHQRARLGKKLDLKVRALNLFTSCCKGQRMGIFAGSGVGKSILMSMLARYSDADINVIGLIGERGREVQEFLQDDLGKEGLKRSVVIVATSDESALLRRQAAYLTLTVAEYFRDQKHDVLCLMDSLTRFAMAQREIGLTTGEPPTSKGYPPSVFSLLPRLLERAGPGIVGSGTITGFFTVLVDGDDHNEPIADAVRGIVDGHIVMDRKIAERGRYPAIDVLKSVSRTLPNCNSDEENALLKQAKYYLSTYEDMAEMIRLGAYRPGSNQEVDQAIKLYPAFEALLAQQKNEATSLSEGYAQLKAILNHESASNS